jgi:hypothetical protein
MTDENDLTIRILREIQATQAEQNRAQTEQNRAMTAVRGDIALIKDTMVQHSLQLSSQGGSLGELARILRHLPDWMRQSPADVLEQLRDLQERLAALESRQQ